MLSFAQYLNQAYIKQVVVSDEQAERNRLLFEPVANQIVSYFQRAGLPKIEFYSLNGDKRYRNTRNVIYFYKNGQYTGFELITDFKSKTLSLISYDDRYVSPDSKIRLMSRSMVDKIAHQIRNKLFKFVSDDKKLPQWSKIDNKHQYGVYMNTNAFDVNKLKQYQPKVEVVSRVGKLASARQLANKKAVRDKNQSTATSDQKLKQKYQKAKQSIANVNSMSSHKVFSKILNILGKQNKLINRDKFTWNVDIKEGSKQTLVKVRINFAVKAVCGQNDVREIEFKFDNSITVDNDHFSLNKSISDIAKQSYVLYNVRYVDNKRKVQIASLNQFADKAARIVSTIINAKLKDLK